MAGVTSMIILSAMAAGAASTGGYMASESLQAGRRAKNAAENLEAVRRKELEDQAAARAAAKAKAETSGQRVGARGQFLSGVGSMGFGSGSTAQGLTSGNLFGN